MFPSFSSGLVRPYCRQCTHVIAQRRKYSFLDIYSVHIHGTHTVDVAVGLDQIAKFVIYHSKMLLQIHIGITDSVSEF